LNYPPLDGSSFTASESFRMSRTSSSMSRASYPSRALSK
jgi:hypothetical protein